MAPDTTNLAAAAPLALDVPASVDGVGHGQPLLARYLEECAIRGRDIARAELVFEEVVMNVAMHAFDNPTGHRVQVTASASTDAIELVFEDRGRAFDPVAATPHARPGKFDEERPGGFGLLLVRRTASSLSYERLPCGINRFRVELSVVGERSAANLEPG